MNVLDETTPSATYSDGFVSVVFAGGARLSFPVRGNPFLERGSAAQLANMKVSRFGIHWPDLDEDLSFEGLARGDFGQYAN